MRALTESEKHAREKAWQKYNLTACIYARRMLIVGKRAHFGASVVKIQQK